MVMVQSSEMITLSSWNVNGLRAVHRKGIFLEWLNSSRPDVLGIQETKCRPEQLPDELRNPAGYHSYWASAERPGYSGVALYSRREPLDVRIGLGLTSYDREGRTIVADYGDFIFVTAYFPNGSRDHSRVPFKMQYNTDFLYYIDRQRENGRAIIFCGDVNTAHREIDLARPRQNGNTTGFLPIERAWLDQVTEHGYCDTFRTLYPEQTGAFTWWSNLNAARSKNIGWRIDYFFVSSDIATKVLDASIEQDVPGSDHCPVGLTLDYHWYGD